MKGVNMEWILTIQGVEEHSVMIKLTATLNTTWLAELIAKLLDCEGLRHIGITRGDTK